MRAALMIVCIAATTALRSVADEPQTIIALNGVRYEKAVVTSVTPAAVTVTHATGVASIPFAELPKEIQEKYHFNPARAAEWEKAVAAAQRKVADDAARQSAAEARRVSEESRRAQADVERITRHLDAGGRIEYDPVTQTLYDPDAAAARRAGAVRFYRQNGYWPISR